MAPASHLLVKVAMLGMILLLGLVLLLFSPWTSPEGFPWSIVTTWLRKQEALDRRNRLLERRNEVGHWRVQAKREVVIELLEGKLSLLQAAAWFEKLDRQPADMPLRHLPGWRNSAEQYCRDVINWARGPLDPFRDPMQQEKVQRLEMDLEGHLSEPDDFVLPPPPRMPFLPPCPEPE